MILRRYRGRGTRTSNVALNRSSRTKRSTSSLAINLFSEQSSRYATTPLSIVAAHAHPWLQDQVSGKLDPAAFPYVKDFPQSTPAASSARPTMTPTSSLRSAKPSWHRAARTGGPAVENRQRLLVFVAGGMTYSEMREAYLLSSQLGKDIFIGAVAQLMLKAEIIIFWGEWW